MSTDAQILAVAIEIKELIATKLWTNFGESGEEATRAVQESIQLLQNLSGTLCSSAANLVDEQDRDKFRAQIREFAQSAFDAEHECPETNLN